MSKDWQAKVERAIREAADRREFDHLSGSGERLPDDNSDVFAGEKALAHKILKNAGYVPDFLQLKRDIERKVDEARTFIRRAIRRRERGLERLDSVKIEQIVPLHRRTWDDWYANVAEFERHILEINVQIEIFNLKNELPRMFMKKFDAAAEREQAEEELGTGS